MYFKKIGVGGTFDRLHLGHKLILDIASFYSEIIHIGLITKEYLEIKRKILGEMIEPFEERGRKLKNYISTRNRVTQITPICKINEDRELAINSDINALIVSQETFPGALVINKSRKSRGKQDLTIIVLPYVLQEDKSVIRSTKIRQSLFQSVD